MDYMNSFMSLCRLCLKPNQGEVSIFQDDKIENSDLYHKITICLPIKISINDDLPKKICYSCSKNVDFVYNFWQLSCNSEKQLQNMLDNVKEFIVQNSDIEIQPENADIIYDTLSVKDMKDWKCLEDDVNDSNIVIQEVDVCDYDEEIVSHIVNENVLPVEESADELILNATDSHPLEVQPPAEDTQISQIVESSNVSLRTFEEQDSLKLKLWNLSLPDFFLIPCSYQIEDKAAQQNSAFLMDVQDSQVELPAVKNKSYSFICSVCSTLFNEMLPFLKHYENVHNLFKCPFCVKHFKRRYILENHLVVHSTKKDFVCPICKMKFKRQSDVRNHIKRIHVRNANVPIFKCDHCSYQTKHKRLIRTHVLNHLGILIYLCDLCGKDFKNNNDLIVHRNNHLGIKPFQCDVCGNNFTRKHYMLTHRKLLHEELYSYQCDVCGRTFSHKTSLVSHMKLHTGENRVQCDVCNKIVSSKISLVNHKKIHSNIKEFVCGICEKVYMNKYSLQEHILVHTGSKPFQCLQCDKSFPTRKKLLNHEQIHEDIRSLFSCMHCDKSYLSKFKLKDHIRKHHVINVGIH